MNTNQIYTYIASDDAEFDALCSDLESLGITREPVYLDVETTSLNQYLGIIVLIQVYYKERIFVLNAIEIPKKSLIRLANALNNHTCIGHNIKFDLKFILRHYGVLLTDVYCTQTMESVINAGIGKPLYSYAELVEKYCYEYIDKSGREEFINFSGVVTETQKDYAARDVIHLPMIQNQQLVRIIDENLVEVMALENKLVPVLASMEHEGVDFNAEAWKELSKLALIELTEKTKKLKEYLINMILEYKQSYKNLYELANDIKLPIKKSIKARVSLESITDIELSRSWIEDHLNLASNLQVLNILNKIVFPRYTQDRLKAVNEKVLSPYTFVPAVSDLLEIRDYAKRLSTYGDSFIGLINPVTNRIHTEYIGVGTVTGRLSSNNPNLQNIPVYPDGYRKCFHAGEGHTFLFGDYSQQELRILGAVSREPKFISAYKNNDDIHQVTASVIFDKKFEEVTKDERRIAKGVNFAMIYGSTSKGLAYNLKIPERLAAEVTESFFKKYQYIDKFLELAKKRVLKTKYSITLLGRKRYFDDRVIFTDSYEMKKFITKVEREGANHIIQGTGADVTKLAMVNLFYKNPFGDKFKLVLQVHDEIIARVENSIKEEAEKFMREIMLGAEQKFLGDTLPAGVDIHFSNIWEK